MAAEYQIVLKYMCLCGASVLEWSDYVINEKFGLTKEGVIDCCCYRNKLVYQWPVFLLESALDDVFAINYLL